MADALKVRKDKMQIISRRLKPYAALLTGAAMVTAMFAGYMVCVSSAQAQYRPIPNYVGIGAGKSFRSDVNSRFSGDVPISPRMVSLGFAGLPPEKDGAIYWCTDCMATMPCKGGGSGAFAMGQSGQWACAPQIQSLSASTTNGSASLTNYNLNGTLNPRAFGATASLVVGSAAATDGNVDVTMSNFTSQVGGSPASSDFQVGQHVEVVAAGPTPTLTAPTGLSATPETYGTQGDGRVYAGGFDAVHPVGCWIDSASSVPPWQASTSYAQYAEVQVSVSGYSTPLIIYATAAGTSGSSSSNLTAADGFIRNGPGNSVYFATSPRSDGGMEWVPVGWAANASNQVANTGCNASRTYTVAAVAGPSSSNPYDGGGGIVPVAPGSYVTITNAPAVPSAANRILVQWNPSPSAIGYIVGACSGSGCTPSVYAVLPAMHSNSGIQQFWDMGHAPTTSNGWGELETGVVAGTTGAQSSAFPTSTINNNLLTTITAINGSVFSLADSPHQTGSFILRHDDQPALQAAVNQACFNGQETTIQIPSGIYPLAKSLNFYGCIGVTLTGSGGLPTLATGATGISQIDWHGPPGGTVVYADKARGVSFRQFAILGQGLSGFSGSTPGIDIDIDNVPTGGPYDGHISTRDEVSHMLLGSSGIAVALARNTQPPSGNNEDMHFDYNTVDDRYTGSYACFLIGGFAQTDNERFIGNNCGPGSFDFTFYFDTISGSPGTLSAGTVTVDGGDFWGQIGAYDAGGGGQFKYFDLQDVENEGWQQAWYSISGSDTFAQPVRISHCHFNPNNLVSNSFFLVGSNFDIDSSRFSDTQYSNPVMKINVEGTSNQANYYPWSAAVVSDTDRFADPQPFQGSNIRVAEFNDIGVGTGGGLVNFSEPVNFGLGIQSLNVIGVQDPASPPTFTITGGGSTTYHYEVVCNTANGGHTNPSPVGTTTSGPTTLDSSNYIRVDWSTNFLATGNSRNPACVSWTLYRAVGSNYEYLATVAGMNYYDNGSATPNATITAPSGNTTGKLVTADLNSPPFAMIYGPVVTPDLSKSLTQTLNITDSNPFEVANPSNMLPGDQFAIQFYNPGASASGSITYASDYNIDSTAPGSSGVAAGKRVTCSFRAISSTEVDQIGACSGPM